MILREWGLKERKASISGERKVVGAQRRSVDAPFVVAKVVIISSLFLKCKKLFEEGLQNHQLCMGLGSGSIW